MSKLRKKKIFIPLLFLFLFGIIYLFVTAQDDACQEYSSSFTDSFDDTTYKDSKSTANWTGDGQITLESGYQLEGKAISAIVSSIDPATQAITKVKVSKFDQYMRGYSSEGLTVTLYVSNNDGNNWELIEKFSDQDITGSFSSDWHYFTHFGSRLRWKAVMTAMDDGEGISDDTPVLTNIGLEYAYVDRREYSRTSAAVTRVEEDGQPLKLAISGSFYYPGWQGHLRAYDVTNMSSVSSSDSEPSDSELGTVTEPDLTSESGRWLAEGVTLKWDAGELLNARSPSDRTIYTALENGGSLSRVDFTASNVPQLESLLIEFIRGEGRDWKLGDINHSNPVVVGPPDNDPVVMGSDYQTFKENYSERIKTVIVGANDGMIHCFNALNGEELWGFIPNNLLPKLKNMWPEDATGTRYYSHDFYVDGTPVVKDVYLDGKGWRTVLICGQGPGLGSDGNYYFALDITDIQDPQPLWEFTDEKMGETWSVPVIGRIEDGTWLAFMGSGYDNLDDSNMQGNRFYAVDIAIGVYLWSFDAAEVSTGWLNEENVLCSFPGSPGIYINNQGYAEAVYIGDTEGRMWKVDVSLSLSDWVTELLYEDPDHYPIITKPAVWIQPGLAEAVPRIYFGTGGDDKAPDDAIYSFIALIDWEPPEVEWYIGDSTLGLPENDDRGDFLPGEKVWSDPVIANSIVYFSTLTGNIEAVDPCQSLAGEGNLYARYVNTLEGSPVGSTAFSTATGQVESLGLAVKTRAAVTIGESTLSGGERKKEVYIQGADSTLQKLEQATGSMIWIKSWREIFKIIK